MPIVRYWRERKASAPSRIASEIARISGLPVSAASTCRASTQATTSDRTLIVEHERQDVFDWHEASVER